MLGVSVSLLPSCSVYRRLIELMFYSGPHALSLLIHLHPTTDVHFSLAAAFFSLFAKHVGDVWHVPQSLLENCTQSRPVEVVVRRPMALTEATRPSARTIKSCMVAAFCVCFLSERRQGGEKRGEGKNWREEAVGRRRIVREG